MVLNKCNSKMRAKDPELKKREKKIPKTRKCGLKKSCQSFNHIRSARKPKMNDKEFGRDDSRNEARGPLKHRVNLKDCDKKPSCNDCLCKCKHPDGSYENEWRDHIKRSRNCRFKK